MFSKIFKIIVVIICIAFFIVAIFKTNVQYKKMSGGTYLFSTNADSINSSIEFKPTDDQQGKLLLYDLLKNNTNRNRYFLMDINSKDFKHTRETISTNDHKLSRIKPKLPDKNIKFISTIEFNEDYYNSHWMKSILSDVTNMAVMVSDEKLLQNETIYEDEIPKELLPFKNIHINYKPTHFKNLVFNKLDTKYEFSFNKLYYDDDTIKSKYMVTETKTFTELLNEILDDDYYINSWIFININSATDIDVNLYFLDEDDYDFSGYSYLSKLLHCYNSKPEKGKVEYSEAISCIRYGLNDLQTKSDYSLKFIKLPDLKEEHLKICIKNGHFTCPDPDGFIVEFE